MRKTRTVGAAVAFLATGITAAAAQTAAPGPPTAQISPTPLPAAGLTSAPSPSSASASKATGGGAAAGKTSPKTSASATPTVSAAPTVTAAPPIIVNVTTPTPPAPEPASNSWAPGLLGMALLGTLGFFGWRYAKQRGLTVAGGLKQLGVEMPQDGVNGAGQVQPLRPTPPPAPPLPSLSDLPAASAMPASPPFASSVPNVVGLPRVVAVAGPLAGETFEITQGITVGRDAENHLPLAQDTTVSRRHARIEPTPSGGYQVTDSGSSNGTFVNGTRITGTHTLTPGDQIQIGTSRLRFEA